MPLKPITLIGATTRDDVVPAPLRSRFHTIIAFEFYEPEELAEIIRNSAEILNIPVDGDAALEIGRRSQGTPRTANQLLLWARAYANVRAKGTVSLEVARAALKRQQIDERGLDKVSRNFMLTIMEKHRGGPVGGNTLAAALSTNKGVLEERYEPFLMSLGFLNRTTLGRTATDLAYEYFKNELPPDTKVTRRVKR